MHQKTFNQIFWGWLLIFLEIHAFVIDILPDPVGYGLVFAALASAEKQYREALIPKRLALVLMIVSIPNVFISNSTVSQTMDPFGWNLYILLIGVLNLILVFYLLKWMLAVSSKAEAWQLQESTRKFSRLYLAVILSTMVIQPFFLNIDANLKIYLAVGLGILSFILQIVLLVYFRRYSKLPHGAEGR